MLDELNRSDTNASEAAFKAAQEDEKERQKIKAQMEKAGVMVHLCRLRNSEVNNNKKPVHDRAWPWKPVYYGDIYVHSKFTIFDDAYLTLGSANWNHRSMTTDTEINIAVQLHNHVATDFRKRVSTSSQDRKAPDCASHSSGIKTKPEDWFNEWDEILRKYFKSYTKNKPLLMNLFPYYEDLEKVREKGIINRIKQRQT